MSAPTSIPEIRLNVYEEVKKKYRHVGDELVEVLEGDDTSSRIFHVRPAPNLQLASDPLELSQVWSRPFWERMAARPKMTSERGLIFTPTSPTNGRGFRFGVQRELGDPVGHDATSFRPDIDILFLDVFFWQAHMYWYSIGRQHYNDAMEAWNESAKLTPEPDRAAFKPQLFPGLSNEDAKKVQHVGLSVSMIWSEFYYRPMLEHVYQALPEVQHFWFFSNDYRRHMDPVNDPDSVNPIVKVEYMSTSEKQNNGIKRWWMPTEPLEHPGTFSFAEQRAKALKHANQLRYHGWNRNPDVPPQSIRFRVATWFMDRAEPYPDDKVEIDAFHPHSDFDTDSSFEGDNAFDPKDAVGKDVSLVEGDSTGETYVWEDDKIEDGETLTKVFDRTTGRVKKEFRKPKNDV